MPIQSKSKDFVRSQAKSAYVNDLPQRQFRPGIYNRHHPQECDLMLRWRPIHLSREDPYEGKNVVRITNKDSVRDLLVPSKDSTVYPAFWRKEDFSRLQGKAKLKTLEDKLTAFKANEQEKKKMLEESERRKKRLQEIDRERQHKSGTVGNVLEDAEARDSDSSPRKIIDRAYLAKQEQEEEVKRANRIILAAKCHIIRDAQIAEKQEIQRELRNEELRLEKMMLQENEKALMEEEKKREVNKLLTMQHSEEIRNQLVEREKTRLKDAERIEEEAKVLKQAQMAIAVEEKRKEKERLDRVNFMRNGLRKAYETSSYYKQVEFEEQRIAELKIQEYMRQRMERQKKLDFEKRIAAEVREKEHDRMLKIQQKLLDTKSEKNDMDLRRGQEHIEREFRRREKVAAIKKKELEQQLAVARAAQLEAVKTERAMQLARDEMEHKKTVEKLKEEESKEMVQKRKQLQLREKYREEIIKQMTLKDHDRKERERIAKNEHSALLEAEKKRDKNIKSIISNKIKMMKESQVPERFIKDVERQLNLSNEK